jgi:hypothetical protein
MIVIGVSSLLPRVLEVGPAASSVNTLEYLIANVDLTPDRHRGEVRGRAVGGAVGQEVGIRAILVLMMMMMQGGLNNAVDRDDRAEGGARGAEPLQVVALL